MTTKNPPTWTTIKYLNFVRVTLDGISEHLTKLPIADAGPAVEPALTAPKTPPPPTEDKCTRHKRYIGSTKTLAIRIAAELADHWLINDLTEGNWAEPFCYAVNVIDRTLNENGWMLNQDAIATEV